MSRRKALASKRRVLRDWQWENAMIWKAVCRAIAEQVAANVISRLGADAVKDGSALSIGDALDVQMNTGNATATSARYEL